MKLAETIPGWADKRLMQAYHLVHEVMESVNPELDVHGTLKALRDAVEDADVELEKLP